MQNERRLLTSLIVGMAVACGGGADDLLEPASAEPPLLGDDGSEPDSGTPDSEPPPEPPEQLCVLTGPPVPSMGDVLVYEDTFSGNAVDPLKWTISNGYRGHGPILNTTEPDNAVVDQGLLSIVTERSHSDPRYPYISGYLDSLGKFARTYGRIEFRARFPHVPGVWFAIWGRPWSTPFPEIDIEVLNSVKANRSQLYFVNHWGAPPLPAAIRRTFALVDDLDLSQFHDYTIDWKPESLEWRIDGKTRLQADSRGIPRLPVYWIVNGWVGGWSGSPPDEAPLPTSFEVDSMKVYRVDGLVADPKVFVPRARATYPRTRVLDVAVANFDEVCAHVSMYDGETLVRTTSTPPYRFALARLSPGAHTLRFVATDGVRTGERTLSVGID
jgi:beta-glucanase (GH16 family)